MNHRQAWIVGQALDDAVGVFTPLGEDRGAGENAGELGRDGPPCCRLDHPGDARIRGFGWRHGIDHQRTQRDAQRAQITGQGHGFSRGKLLGKSDDDRRSSLRVGEQGTREQCITRKRPLGHGAGDRIGDTEHGDGVTGCRRIEHHQVVLRLALEGLGGVPPRLAQHGPVVEARECAEEAAHGLVLEHGTVERFVLEERDPILVKSRLGGHVDCPKSFVDTRDVRANGGAAAQQTAEALGVIGLREQNASSGLGCGARECRGHGRASDATLTHDEEEPVREQACHAGVAPLVLGLAGNMLCDVYNASMSRKRAMSTNRQASDFLSASTVGRDSAAKVVLHRGRARPLWFGHPWVYAKAVDRVEGRTEPGSVVSLLDHDGRFIGRGIYNPRSQIAVRLLTRLDEAIDAAFFVSRLRAARSVRATLALPNSRTTAYRLVNSEGDGLPGLVVDVFGAAAVLQVSTLGMSLWREAIVAALEAVLSPATIYEVAATSFAEIEGFAAETRVLRGEAMTRVACQEDGILIEAEPLQGQKTGLFLDQRPSRVRVGQMVAAAPERLGRVLDCYAYNGGFSLQAARAGAREITAVDSSSRAVARIEAHAAANGAQVRAVESDAFRFLETATPLSYDLVIVDPPKFARARKDIEAATKGYERLNTLALGVCAPGAVLVTCSCSQNIGPVELERILAAAARQANREVRVIERQGPGPDHPLPPGFGEGQYLNVLFAWVQ